MRCMEVSIHGTQSHSVFARRREGSVIDLRPVAGSSFSHIRDSGVSQYFESKKNTNALKYSEGCWEGLHAMQSELNTLNDRLLCGTQSDRSVLGSEVSKRGWREGVGDKQTPKRAQKILQKCVPLLPRGHRKKGQKRGSNLWPVNDSQSL